MTTPSFSGMGSSLLGANDLQQAIDNLTTAVKTNTDAVKGQAQAPGGTTTVPFGNSGQSFTSGSFPRMAPAFAAFEGSGAGTPGNYVTAPTGGGGNGQGGWGNPQQTLASSAGQLASGVGTALTSTSSQFGSMMTMNQFAAMSSLGFAPGTNLGQGFRAMYSQAFGNYGQNLNAIAQNPADAAQMYSTLQSIAGSPYVMSNSLGQAGFGAAAGIGYASMGQLSGAQAAQAAAQLYSGQTSMSMRQLGYSGTARAGMGQQNPMQMGGVIQSMLQRWYGKGSVNQANLNAGLANNGRLQLNLQALGLDPQTMGPAIQTYNKLFQQGLNPTQAQTLLNDAAQNKNYNGQSAQKLLSNKYGIATSDIQKMNDTNSIGTSNQAGEMGGFDSALSAATTTIQHFDQAISKLLKDTGLGTLIGGAHGLGGTIGSVGGLLGGLAGKAMGMLSGLAGGAATAGSSLPGGSSGNASGSAPNKNSSAPSRAALTAVKDAESQLGKPYVWGGSNPTTSFDCSGLVQWAYGQAGIQLPRTSEEQWQALKNRSVPLDKVEEGDLVFAAGSDGSDSSPGHVGLMISSKALIQAPYTGANIDIISYSPGAWQHAARPSGSLLGGGTSGSNGIGGASTTTGQGNTGAATGIGGLGMNVGNYGSSNELGNTQAALSGAGLSGAGISNEYAGAGGSTLGSSSVGNGQGSAKASKNVSTAGGGSPSANEALAKKLAAQMYGWTGSQWTQGLLPLWTQESGFSNTAQNPTSTAYGIAQFLDSTWGPYGPKTSNPGLQEKYGLEYIKGRYGSPLAAEAHERAYNWYAGGTKSARGGVALVGERGPELVHLSGGQEISNAKQTSDILQGISAKPGQAPWQSNTAQSLMLGPYPQNQQNNSCSGQHNVNLNMPEGAIVIHTSGSATDVSNNVRQIMSGVQQAMSDNDTLRQIMSGVTS